MLFLSFLLLTLQDGQRYTHLHGQKHHLEFIKSTASQAPIPERLECLGWDGECKILTPTPTLSLLLQVVLEPSLEEHCLGLVCYLPEAISENPGIIEYTEIALL